MWALRARSTLLAHRLGGVRASGTLRNFFGRPTSSWTATACPLSGGFSRSWATCASARKGGQKSSARFRRLANGRPAAPIPLQWRLSRTVGGDGYAARGGFAGHSQAASSSWPHGRRSPTVSRAARGSHSLPRPFGVSRNEALGSSCCGFRGSIRWIAHVREGGLTVAHPDWMNGTKSVTWGEWGERHSAVAVPTPARPPPPGLRRPTAYQRARPARSRLPQPSPYSGTLLPHPPSPGFDEHGTVQHEFLSVSTQPSSDC